MKKYVYENPDGTVAFTKVVPDIEDERCAKCDTNDIRDKGSFYACNVCGHRGEHGLTVFPGGKQTTGER